jgi:hypothetical protein
MKSRTPYIAVLIGLLAIVLLCSVLLNAWAYLQIYGIGGWRDQVFASEGAAASDRALDDFRDGRLRLYCLGGESEKAKYSGTNDGPFEIWIPQFYPSLGRAHRYSTEQFIEFYNRKMQYMHTHPDKFLGQKKEVQPDGAANGSQPIRSETNRTSSAAGSRR